MKKRNEQVSRRMFDRVQFDSANGILEEILGAVALWENGEASRVFDMSYSGVALSKPEKLDLKVCHKYSLSFKLGNRKPCDVMAEVMWFNDTVVGLAFEPLCSDTRFGFNEFLDDKLVGANLRAVSPALFSKIMDCDHWYQGPNDTNVYLWIKDEGKIDRAVAELNDFFLRFENGRIVEIGGGASEGGIHSKYAEITDEVSIKNMRDSDRDFVVRVIGVLSQIQEQKGPIKHLLKQLAESDY